MNYFSKRGFDYTAKNSLQKFLLDQVDQFDHLLVEDAKKFEQAIRTIVTNANRSYPRCTPLEVHFGKSEGKVFHRGEAKNIPQGYWLKIGELIQFNLYCVVGELTGKLGRVLPMNEKVAVSPVVQFGLDFEAMANR